MSATATGAIEIVRRLLGEKAGLDPGAMSDNLLRSLVEARLRHHGSDCATWLERLRGDRAEQQSVIETALVHETWFFRDVAPFDHLMDLARDRWLRRTAANPVRILSAPCASGEEAWSIAATLVQAGLAPEAVAVTAIDLSGVMVKVAQCGVYGARSLRNHHGDLIRPYVEPLPDGFRIGALLRGCVSFSQVNLLHLPDERGFDAIFCRNALMYMHETARRKIVGRLKAALAPEAPLFVGHAEAAMLMSHGLYPSGPSRAFALRLRPAEKPCRPEAPLPPPGIRPPVAIKPALVTPEPGKGPAEIPADLLMRAHKLADSGALDEALVPLRRFLDAVPMSPEGHALAGMILAARGERTEGIRHLRKALYLNPRDEASKVHLQHLLDAPR